ncbi:hypothetical protein H072_3063 [Dactylellina haptotyla CBS 200.50]|uniref:DUF6697 domain-containing protein n=1 Tax=Dactylellina haptotyla (strain CBS 200.50) TaxID=1284197 RepID=S8BTZ5_DACHA|nr:hypothetical protein H072_3063 [Dactylellina haptotyla CBS 200.50]
MVNTNQVTLATTAKTQDPPCSGTMDLYARYGSNLFGRGRQSSISNLQSPPASRVLSCEASIPSPLRFDSFDVANTGTTPLLKVATSVLETGVKHTPPTSSKCSSYVAAGNTSSVYGQQLNREVEIKTELGCLGIPFIKAESQSQSPRDQSHSKILKKSPEDGTSLRDIRNQGQTSDRLEFQRKEQINSPRNLHEMGRFKDRERRTSVRFSDESLGLPARHGQRVVTSPNNRPIPRLRFSRGSDQSLGDGSLFIADSDNEMEFHSPVERIEKDTANHDDALDEGSTKEESTNILFVSSNIPKNSVENQTLEQTTVHPKFDIDIGALAKTIVKLMDERAFEAESQLKRESNVSAISPRKRKRTPGATVVKNDNGFTHTFNKGKAKANPDRHQPLTPDSESDEEAFCRTRKSRKGNLAPQLKDKDDTANRPISDSRNKKSRDAPQDKSLEELRFRKRNNTESYGSTPQGSLRNPLDSSTIVVRTNRKESLLYRDDLKGTNGSRDRCMAEVSPIKSKSASLDSKSTSLAIHPTKRPGPSISRRERQESQPNDYWFQRYYNRLISQVQKPKILGSTGNLFSRTKIGYYIGGSSRLTAATVSREAMSEQIFPVDFLMAFNEQLSPIRPEKPGDVIVIATMYDFRTRVPAYTSSFPVFFQRGVGEYEYMGSYEFDDKVKTLSDKETRDLIEPALVDFWIDRLFIRPWSDHGHKRTRQPGPPRLGVSGASALTSQLVPDHVKRRSDIYLLTEKDVRKYILEGTVRLMWSFLKPVKYEQGLYNALSKAKWPVDKKNRSWSALKKDR